LSNVCAGMVLLLARPFQVGDTILLRAGGLGGELTGTVTNIGITYVRIDTGGSVMSVPNSQVLNAVVGPQPQPEPQPSAAVPVSPPGDDPPTPPGAS
jgi:small-conductance mechanosensitive channel